MFITGKIHSVTENQNNLTHAPRKSATELFFLGYDYDFGFSQLNVNF